MKTPRNRPHAAARQRGVSLLIVTLLIMAILLMTLSALYISRTQYRLVGNIQASELAFSRAEEALVNAQAWLNVTANARAAGFDTYNNATPQIYPAGGLAAASLVPATMTWTDSNSVASGDARYLIELIGRNVRKPGDSINLGQASTGCRSVDLFRIVTRADAGLNGSRIVETTESRDGC